MIKLYTVDLEAFEDDLESGISRISNVAHPAIQVKGVAMSEEEKKKLYFKDNVKLRIASPVLIPMWIYRLDDEEYELQFTAEAVEAMAKKFMKNLNQNIPVFNDDHTDSVVNSYILEIYLLDSQAKVDMVNEEYGLILPLGSLFAVQQFIDEKTFYRIVDEGKVGFSIEGFVNTKIYKEQKLSKHSKKKKIMKKKLKFIGQKRTFVSASKRKKTKFEAINDEVIIVVEDELEEGAHVSVVEEIGEEPIEDFTGEIEVVDEDGDEVVLIIEDGDIEEIVEVEEIEEEVDTEAEVVVELEEEEEEKKEEELEEDAVASVNGDLAEAIDSMVEAIVDLKAEIAELKSLIKGVSEEEVIEVEMNRQNPKFSNSLLSFNRVFKNR